VGWLFAMYARQLSFCILNIQILVLGGNMKRVYIVSALLLLTSSLNAQIIECRAINDTNLSVQFAKYKSEKLRSANGTIYEKDGYNYKKDMTYYSAITKKRG
jgi:hypothetical protein